MKKLTFFAIAFLLSNNAISGGVAGGSTEVTQVMNNTELLNIVSQNYQSYRTMVSRLQIMAQNAQTGGIVSLRPEELMYYIDEIDQMGRIIDSSSSAVSAKTDELELYAKKNGYGDSLTLKQIEEENRKNREKLQRARSEALAQIGMTQEAYVKRQNMRQRIKNYMDSGEYGTEKALRTLQLLAEQQQDVAERQLALMASTTKAEMKIQQAKDEAETENKKQTLRFFGFSTDKYRQ